MLETFLYYPYWQYTDLVTINVVCCVDSIEIQILLIYRKRARFERRPLYAESGTPAFFMAWALSYHALTIL